MVLFLKNNVITAKQFTNCTVSLTRGDRIMNTHVLSQYLSILGILGLVIFITLACAVSWYYHGYPEGSFRWRLRHMYLKQISALASLFCIAMAVSYSLLTEGWAIFYFILACKAGTWWLCYIIDQHA